MGTTDTNDTNEQPATNADTTSDDSGELGEGGKRALEAERQLRRDAERRAREATERLQQMEAEQHAREAEQLRRDVAGEHGLSDAQAAFLTGETRDELDQAATALLTAFGTTDSPPSSSSRDATSRLPREQLRPGGLPNGGESAGELADKVMRSGW